MRDSLNHVQGNDLGAGWIDHHADLLLLFAFVIWDGKSRVTYLQQRDDVVKPKPQAGMAFDPCRRQSLPIVGFNGEDEPRPFYAGTPKYYA